MVKNNKLILSLDFPGHQIATMSICMHKSLLVYHLDNHTREQFPYLLSIYFVISQLVDFIEMNSIDILHYQHPFGWFQLKKRDVDVIEMILFQKFTSSFHICRLDSKIQLQTYVLLKTLY